MYPNKDAPRYLNGFTATCCLLAVCVLSYATLPLWLLYEAKQRKAKTGHALPLQAMVDSENSQVSADTLARIHELNALEESNARLQRKLCSKRVGLSKLRTEMRLIERLERCLRASLVNKWSLLPLRIEHSAAQSFFSLVFSSVFGISKALSRSGKIAKHPSVAAKVFLQISIPFVH
jgi:hypothetical protein